MRDIYREGAKIAKGKKLMVQIEKSFIFKKQVTMIWVFAFFIFLRELRVFAVKDGSNG